MALTDWIRAARTSRIPHVPADVIATFERDDLRNHEYEGPHQARLDIAFEKARRGVNQNTMRRWDCCASGDLKLDLADAAANIDVQVRNQLAIDIRLQEMLFDYPRIEIPALLRPWITKALKTDRYPVEYRAYVEGDRLIGISSYYPQRPLRRQDDELRAVVRMSEALLNTLKPPFQWPFRPDHEMRKNHFMPATAKELAAGNDKRERNPERDPNRMHFTADFLVTPNEVLFLEGGPPSFMGAHPCCFENRDRIEGVALNCKDRTFPLAELGRPQS